MSFAGHVLDMIHRQKNNRKLVSRRRRLFSGMNEQIALKYRHHTRDEKYLSPEQLNELKARLIMEGRLQFIKKCMAFLLASIIVILLFYGISHFLSLEDFFV